MSISENSESMRPKSQNPSMHFPPFIYTVIVILMVITIWFVVIITW